jgi:hypothetical protein
MKRTYSPTYVSILDLLYKTSTIKLPVSKSSFNNGNYSRESTGHESVTLSQDFYVAAAELWSMCNSSEWHLVGRISSELKSYNSLWKCPSELKKSNGTAKAAISSLIQKNILIKTETTDIYLVNPIYIRRGDFLAVLNTTASLLMNEAKVAEEHIKNCKPIKELDVKNDAFITGKLLG